MELVPNTRSSARRIALWIGAVSALGLLLFCFRHLDGILKGRDRFWGATLVDEMTSSVGIGVLFFAVLWVVKRFPISRAVLLTRLPMYLVFAIAFGSSHTLLMIAQREVLHPWLGFGDYDCGSLPLRFAMELPLQTIGFVVMVIALHGVASIRTARERELRAAQLQSSLARAQIENLRLQLQPHFLFNALNTISATMYRDPRVADELIENLADLLRASLRTARTDEVPLREELAILGHYVALQKARFGDDLQVVFDIAEDAKDAVVPSLLLQPLVENAVRHGNAARIGRGVIAVRAARAGGRLRIEIEDDGPGADEAELARGGLGVSATRARLQLLYGEAQRFVTERVAGGGFRVRIIVPGVEHGG